MSRTREGFRKVVTAALAVVMTISLCPMAPALAYADDVAADDAALEALDSEVVTVEEFDYEGDAVNAIKADGSGFGMFAPQEGTAAVLSGNVVKVTYYPKSTTVYAGFYLDAGISDESWEGKTYIELDSDGKFELELDTSYCGKAWPIAPIKKKDGATSSDQYYLAIPAADKLARIYAEEFDYEGDAVNAIKADGSGFGMFAPQEGTAASIVNDEVQITFVPKNKTVYGGFYLGADIGDESTWNEDSFFAVDESGNYSFELDASYCGKAWPIAPIKKKDGATSSDQYYLAIPAADKLDKAIELYCNNNERMFKVVKAVLEDSAEGQDYLTLYLSGQSYSWAFSGSQDEAVASFEDKESDSRWVAQLGKTTFDSAVIYGTYNGGTATAEAGYGFHIPVEVPAGESRFSFDVVAYASDFSARNFAIDLDSFTLNTGSASDTAAVTIASELDDIVATSEGMLEYTGYVRPYAGGDQAGASSPLSNDFVGTLSINIGAGIYDQAYVVTYEGKPWLPSSPAIVDPLDSDYATIAEDGSLVLRFFNEYDSSPQTTQLDGNKMTVKMHVAESASCAEANQWVERTFQLDFTNRTAATLTISGDQLTVAPGITTDSLPTGIVGKAYKTTVKATGTPAPTITATGLPAGLSCKNGVISGTPTKAGTYTVKLKAENEGGTVEKSLTLTVNA